MHQNQRESFIGAFVAAVLDAGFRSVDVRHEVIDGKATENLCFDVYLRLHGREGVTMRKQIIVAPHQWERETYRGMTIAAVKYLRGEFQALARTMGTTPEPESVPSGE